MSGLGREVEEVEAAGDVELGLGRDDRYEVGWSTTLACGAVLGVSMSSGGGGRRERRGGTSTAGSAIPAHPGATAIVAGSMVCGGEPHGSSHGDAALDMATLEKWRGTKEHRTGSHYKGSLPGMLRTIPVDDGTIG